jgi:GDP-L-fucose synthase
MSMIWRRRQRLYSICPKISTRPIRSRINVGTGSEVSIADLASLVARATGFKGGIRLDATKPGGTMRKVLDVSRLTRMGRSASIPLEQGVEETYRWFLNNHADLRGWTQLNRVFLVGC